MDPLDIVIEAPGKNALGSDIMNSLRRRIADGAGRPLLLTGAGDAFSAGLNLKEVASLDADGMRDFLLTLEALIQDLFAYPGPTVAAVNGHAIAGGAVLALCCDHIVATTNPRVRIGLNEVALGLRFPPTVLQVVSHRLPRRHHAQVLLGAALHAPADALRLGLVDQLADDPVAVARQHLAALAAHPPDAYAATKADLHGAVGQVDADSNRRFADDVLPVWTSAAVKARIDAVLNRSRKG